MFIKTSSNLHKNNHFYSLHGAIAYSVQSFLVINEVINIGTIGEYWLNYLVLFVQRRNEYIWWIGIPAPFFEKILPVKYTTFIKLVIVAPTPTATETSANAMFALLKLRLLLKMRPSLVKLLACLLEWQKKKILLRTKQLPKLY